MTATSDCVPDALASFFESHRRVALAYSGGVDSSYLLYAASECGADVRAYTAENVFRSPMERANSHAVAELLDVEVTTIDTDPLNDPDVSANRTNRCYLCKKMIFGAIIRAACADGYDTVCDASNASDDPAERPGMRALEELGVLSPLRSSGLTKDDVRRLSRIAGLPCWNSPSDSCLATRIQTGTKITAELLERTRASETELRDLRFSGIRVRTLADGTASLEIPESQMPIFKKHVAEIDRVLNRMYGSYTVTGRKVQ